MFKNTFADIEYILTTCAGNNTRFEIECYDIGHLYTLRHFLDRGLVKPPLFVQSVFGILGGIGAHPEDVMHDEAHRRPAARRQLSLVGARRRRQPDAGRGPGRGDGRQCPRRHGGFALGRAGPARRSRTPQQVTKVRQILEGLGLEIASPDEAREILSLKGGDKVNF